jgi:nitroimidazol reductase NimA-like FMN-containing flavoprotein (pyridoxamine 5'-phosphate oxidase superfamily)
MAVIDSRTWLIHLSDAECWKLLDEHAVGRIGVLVNSAPEVYPVNYRTDGRSLLFRTDPGSKLHGLERSPSVCFEIDGLEPASRTGWSVLVKGRARQLVDADEVRSASRHQLDYWSIGAKAHWVRIDPYEVTGRRILPSHARDR